MKAYLVLDVSVNDFGGFRKYIAEIPAFIARHSGKYLVQGVQPTTVEGDWPNAWSSANFRNAQRRKPFWATPTFGACSRCATLRPRANWCLSMAAPRCAHSP
ncbi:DUF1330 domain-containing protein [Bradyrhizobium sp. AUGA SZCCT0042]|uniref:DUF1330 domain-containing protein n=1 Tax=unclassified Bradyrhizobium TaxID=2631580 RepID=UPI003908991E